MSYWALCQTEPQREHAVRLYLMRARFETWAPRIRRSSTRIEFCFPTYIFVRIIDRWYPVRWTVGVTRMLMDGEQPAKVPEIEMSKLRKREIGGFIKLPSKDLKKGQKVQIVRGTFAGMDAIYDGTSAHERVSILLAMMGQQVAVELPKRDIRPLNVAL